MSEAQMAQYLNDKGLSHGKVDWSGDWVCIQPNCDMEHHFYVRPS